LIKLLANTLKSPKEDWRAAIQSQSLTHQLDSLLSRPDLDIRLWGDFFSGPNSLEGVLKNPITTQKNTINDAYTVIALSPTAIIFLTRMLIAGSKIPTMNSVRTKLVFSLGRISFTKKVPQLGHPNDLFGSFQSSHSASCSVNLFEHSGHLVVMIK
jgi:hypothetical protein